MVAHKTEVFFRIVIRGRLAWQKPTLFGHRFGVIFDSFFEPFLGRQFPTPEMSFSSAVWHPKLVPKTGPKRVQNRDPEMPMKPVICVLENGVRPVRGSQKLLKNDPKMVQKASVLGVLF